MTLQEAVHQGTKLLEDARIPAPRLTAEVLLSHAVQCRREWLYSHATDELKELWWIHYGRYLHERIQGKPTQYITHVQEFYGRPFRVSPAVLIPRPETEHLVEAALARLGEDGPMIDVGTGSGAIAVTLALESKVPVFASDLSWDALQVARANAAALGAAVTFVQADLLEGIGAGSMQMVVSNPPYVPLTERDGLAREVRDHEPHMALFGGEDGFVLYSRLIEQAGRVLRPGGWLLMELAYNGAARVQNMLESGGCWTGIELIPDLAGYPRVIAASLRRASMAGDN